MNLDYSCVKLRNRKELNVQIPISLNPHGLFATKSFLFIYFINYYLSPGFEWDILANYQVKIKAKNF